jgi:ubiquitin-large subunit ribosomal protein L40e
MPEVDVRFGTRLVRVPDATPACVGRALSIDPEDVVFRFGADGVLEIGRRVCATRTLTVVDATGTRQNEFHSDSRFRDIAPKVWALDNIEGEMDMDLYIGGVTTNRVCTFEPRKLFVHDTWTGGRVTVVVPKDATPDCMRQIMADAMRLPASHIAITAVDYFTGKALVDTIVTFAVPILLDGKLVKVATVRTGDVVARACDGLSFTLDQVRDETTGGAVNTLRVLTDGDSVRLTALDCSKLVPMFVRYLHPKTGTVAVDLDWTVQDLMDIIYGKTGVPVSMQRLLFQSTQLDPDKTLRDSMLKRDATVHLVLRLRAGMMHKTSGRADMDAAPPPVETVVLWGDK